MGFSLRWPLWIALVASFLFYRRDLVITNILVRTPLPSGYVANGEYSNCKLLSEYAPPPNASQLNSCEDVVFWDLYNGNSVERALLVSCDANRRNWNTVMGPLKDPTPHGQLWLYVPPTSKTTAASSALKLERGKSHPVSLVNYPQNHDFHPLGLAIWPSHSGNASNLYIVNHARQRTFIEHFQMDPHNPTEAKHIKTVSSPYFLSPNALALTSPDAFYVTNDHLMTRRLPIVGTVLPIIETVGGIPLSFVLHVQLTLGSEEPTVTLAAPWIAFANGISISPSGTHVAVVSSSNNQVYFFHRDPTTNALTYRSKAFVPFCPDNVHFAQPGLGGAGGRGGEDSSVLLVAGHPNFKDLQSFAANAPGPGSFAGSWVVELTPRLPSNSSTGFTDAFDLRAPPDLTKRTISLNKDWSLRTVFQSNGVESEGGFPSSATGLRDPDTGALYVAGLYASGGVLACEPR